MSDKSSDIAWEKWTMEDLGSQFSILEPEMIDPLRSEGSNDEEWQAELNRLRQLAEKKGFEQGLAQGLEKGLAEGKTQGYAAGLEQGKKEGIEQGLAQAAAEQKHIIDELNQFYRSFRATLDATDKAMPAKLMQIAMSAARYVLGEVPVCNNDALLARIKHMMQDISLISGEPLLYVHSTDLLFLQEHLAEFIEQQGWKLVADNSVGKGGCRISGGGGEFDNTLAVRWQMLTSLAMEETSS